MPIRRTVFLSHSQITALIRDKIAINVMQDYYRNHQGKPIVIVGVMKGAYVFLNDIGLWMQGENIYIDFVEVKSRRGKNIEPPVLVRDLDIDIAGKYVFIVDEINDTGATLNFLVENFKNRNPAAVRTICLIESKKSKHKADFFAKEVTGKENRFYYGYGMDDERGFGRNSNCVYYDEEIKDPE